MEKYKLFRQAKVKRIQYHHHSVPPALQQMLKGLTQSRNTEKKKQLQNQPQTIKKMAI